VRASVFVCVCMYICTYVRTYIHTHVRMYCVGLFVRMYVCVYIFMKEPKHVAIISARNRNAEVPVYFLKAKQGYTVGK
jgi:uncharacterized DUF497 family protein